MRPAIAALFGLVGLALHGMSGPAAAAGTSYDRIEARGALQCGEAADHDLALHAARLCRTIAVAMFGAAARFDIRHYASSRDLARAREDVSFVVDHTLATQKNDGALRPGPPIVVERQVMMVADHSAFRHPADLAGHAVCFIIGTTAETALQAWASTNTIAFVPNAFQEPDEMADAYNVQRCQAVVGETSDLDALRRDGGITHLASRVLPDALATRSLRVATPRDRDSRWTGFVAHALGHDMTDLFGR